MKWKQSLRNLLMDKGYFLAFAICLAAVLVSGWLFVRSLRDEDLTVRDAVPAAVLPTLGEDRSQVRSGNLPARQNHPATPSVSGAEAPTEPPAQTEAPEKPQRPGAVLCRPLEGTVAQGYSMDELAYNPTTKDWRTHAGSDIAAAEGSEVRAVAEGTVLSVFADDRLGQTVTVEHAGGYVTHYANLAEEVAVAAGDRVVAGQTLGTVGRTAITELAAEPHLHFAVYKNNVPQDPETYLEG